MKGPESVHEAVPVNYWRYALRQSEQYSLPVECGKAGYPDCPFLTSVCALARALNVVGAPFPLSGDDGCHADAQY
jgi:hypothetical protein